MYYNCFFFQEYHFVAEFATPLLCLYEMEKSNLCDFGQKDKLFQMHRFRNILTEILEHPQNKKCHNSALIVQYKGNFSGIAKITSA